MESSFPKLQLLRECRELVTSRMQTTVTRVVNETAVALERQTLGGSSPGPGAEAFDAVRELRQRRREFLVCFEHRFHELFERRLHEPGDTAVGDRVVPQSCRAILLEVDRRMETLLQRAPSPKPPNPMEPEILNAAFDAACVDIAAAEPVRRALLELFQRHLISELPRVYGEVNALLARKGISAARLTRGARLEAGEPFSSLPGLRPKLATAAQPARIEANDVAIRALLDARISRRTLPHFVRAFALDTWSTVLALVKMNKGEGSMEWDLAMKTLDDLVTSVETFEDPVQRRVSIWKLPGLVRRLKSGMNSIRVPQQDQALFLKTLRAWHLRVLGQRPVVAPEFPLPESYDV